MSTVERTIFWIFTGACMGFGLIAFGLGFLPFFFGAVLALYGIRRIGAQGFWITLVSIGIVPIGVGIDQYVTADPTTTWYPTNSLLLLVAVFSPIVLAGLIWGYREHLQLHRGHAR